MNIGFKRIEDVFINGICLRDILRNREQSIDLRNADLSGVNLSGVDLSYANL